MDGVEVYAKIDGQLIEILEAGLAHPEVLAGSGIDPEKYTGLALGTGLDRLLMVRKKLPDIRLIRTKDPRIAKQMLNLDIYVPVSTMPAISRDMSYSVPKDYGEEDISKAIRVALGEAVEILESVEILSQTDYQDLPVVAKEKLGIQPDKKNILVRVVLRSLDQTLTKDYANILLDQIYLKINYGEKGYKNVV
jgi:phenylalanyl-tRNA synthetase alpha chain